MPAGEPVEWDRPTPSQLNRTASTLLFKTVAAGVSALLLLWVVVNLPAPRTNEGASLQPSSSAAQAPSIPPRTETVAPPQSNRSSQCSAAHEAAGLCKSQK